MPSARLLAAYADVTPAEAHGSAVERAGAGRAIEMPPPGAANDMRG